MIYSSVHDAEQIHRCILCTCQHSDLTACDQFVQRANTINQTQICRLRLGAVLYAVNSTVTVGIMSDVEVN